MPLSFSLDHVGPLARSAEDVALMLQVIAGADPNDPTTAARPVPDYAPSCGAAFRGLRLVVARGGLDAALDAEVAVAVERWPWPVWPTPACASAGARCRRSSR